MKDVMKITKNMTSNNLYCLINLPLFIFSHFTQQFKMSIGNGKGTREKLTLIHFYLLIVVFNYLPS